jgi:serine/threonine protein kinase
MHVYRHHFEPALHLDPRFSAPEYFDRDFGSIDHATDVYQLGTVIFYMFTGRPPYTGEFQRVRESVLAESPPPAPSDHAEDVPAGLDNVVAKAMATQKLTRYETVDHLQQDLVGIKGDDDG